MKTLALIVGGSLGGLGIIGTGTYFGLSYLGGSSEPITHTQTVADNTPANNSTTPSDTSNPAPDNSNTPPDNSQQNSNGTTQNTPNSDQGQGQHHHHDWNGTGNGGGGNGGGQRGGQMFAQLGLTDDQKAQIQQIRDTVTDRQARRDAIMKILTPDQQAKLQELRSQMHHDHPQQ